MKADYGYTKQCLIKDGKPWFPVMGEMHYSRYREDFWEESLRKMKAGGVSIVSAYVIWIHHEEEEGVFDFGGCRDIGRFMGLCKKVGLSVFLRIGPFVHGEVRNGGFPDWLVEKEKAGMTLRSNDETYLSYVRRFWTKVYEQIQDTLTGEDSPLIGVQIENEYGHVGGLRGPEGEAHIRSLTAMAREIGYKASLYTATGWGGACIGDLLPVMGGYCEAPWDQRTCEIEPNNNYVFSKTRNDELIACDHHVENVNTYDETKFPFLTAELGGGLQVTEHRRPVASGRDIGAMSTVKLGSGAALLGYYMYHGGSNPKGKFSTLQESKATGYLNNLPEINYDFNAPIRQYGTISDNYKEIKLLAYFLQDFGQDMAALPVEVPEVKIVPGDMETLRISCRCDANHGYVFFNNYQRRMHMKPQKNVELTGYCSKAKEIRFPKLDIEEGMYGFFPYRMKLGDAILRSVLATPLCKLQTGETETYIFYGDQDPKPQWETEEKAEILFLSREDALQAWKIRLEQDYLVISENFVWEEDGVMKVTGDALTKIQVYPEPAQGIPGFTKCGENGPFSIYQRKIENSQTKIKTVQVSKDAEKAEYTISISYGKEKEELVEKRLAGQDILLGLTYAGEHMDIFCEDQKINDHFYTGQEVPLSLGYYDFPEALKIVIYALHETDAIFIEETPEFKNGMACELTEVRLVEQFR